jgi:allophanate hydrolase
MGGRRLPVDFGPFREAASLLYEGPWLAERLACVGDFLSRHGDAVHPVTRTILERGREVTGTAVFQGMYQLQSLRAACLKVFDQAEVLVVPTMPTIPTLAQVQGDSLGWSRRLGHYTNFVNLLQLAALALPAGFTTRGLPGGITLIGPPGSDGRLCDIGMAWQQRLRLPLGATGVPFPGLLRAEGPPPVAAGCVRVAVAGAHLRGQPLHRSLVETGANFVRVARTAARYRFLGFLDLAPPRPGLLRVESGGASVQVELYDLPMEGFGRLVASVAPPLAIGTVELENGEAVKGFLCESCAAAHARDITEFGGWVAFLKGRSKGAPPA